MQLCENRPEAFKSVSTISDPLPTQCFFDTILVPLPTWLLIAALLLLPLALPATEASSTGGRPRPGARRRWVRLSALSLYYFLAASAAGMHALEVGRLAAAGLGFALLPFAMAGCLLAALSRAFASQYLPVRMWGPVGASTAFWLVGFAISTAKVSALTRFFGTEEGNDFTSPLARAASPYPVRDQVIDLAVLMGLYLSLAGLEVALTLWVVPGGVGKVDGGPGAAHIELAEADK